MPPSSICFVSQHKVMLLDIARMYLRLVPFYSMFREKGLPIPTNCRILAYLIGEIDPILGPYLNHRQNRFDDYLNLSLGLDCSKPRDRIYGVLGVYRGNDRSLHSLPQPDYTKPIGHVFRDVTRYAYQECGRLYGAVTVNHRSV